MPVKNSEMEEGKMQTVEGLVKKLEAENTYLIDANKKLFKEKAQLKNQVKMLSQAIEKNKNLIMYQLEMIYDKEVAMVHDQAMRERAMKDDG